MKVVDRKSKKEYEYKYSFLVKFLYNTFVGRIILKLLCNKLVANIVACFMNSRLSKFLVNKKIKDYNIDMKLYEDKDYNNYNEFFTRKLKKNKVNLTKNVFISPCDSKLLALKLDDKQKFNVKGYIYNAREIINDEIIKDFYNGYALIFRLDVNDYHRYCYIDNGSRDSFHYIKGILHTVQPIAYDKVKVFHRNSREWCVLHTDNFDDVIHCEVGAMMVGRICNNNELINFNKGDEKGYFKFGGSTIILFVKENVIELDKDILENSSLGKETIVHYGEQIGKKM